MWYTLTKFCEKMFCAKKVTKLPDDGKFSAALGKLIHEKNLKLKMSCQTLLKHLSLQSFYDYDTQYQLIISP